MAAGGVASQAEDRKKVKYSRDTQAYVSPHIAYETSGVVGPLSLIFVKELGHRLSATTGDTKSYSYLLQRLSVAVQRDNAASIIGTLFFFWGGGGGGGGGGLSVCLLYMDMLCI